MTWWDVLFVSFFAILTRHPDKKKKNYSSRASHPLLIQGHQVVDVIYLNYKCPFTVALIISDINQVILKFQRINFPLYLMFSFNSQNPLMQMSFYHITTCPRNVLPISKFSNHYSLTPLIWQETDYTGNEFDYLPKVWLRWSEKIYIL